jgi:hypothetical protein
MENKSFLLHDSAPHTGELWSRVSWQITIWEIWSTLHTLLNWLQLSFTCSLNWNQYWSGGVFVMLLTSLRMGLKGWEGFHKMASRKVSNIFTVAGRRGLFWRKCGLNYCTVFCFSELKWFLEHFADTTHIMVRNLRITSVIIYRFF